MSRVLGRSHLRTFSSAHVIKQRDLRTKSGTLSNDPVPVATIHGTWSGGKKNQPQLDCQRARMCSSRSSPIFASKLAELDRARRWGRLAWRFDPLPPADSTRSSTRFRQFLASFTGSVAPRGLLSRADEDMSPAANYCCSNYSLLFRMRTHQRLKHLFAGLNAPFRCFRASQSC